MEKIETELKYVPPFKKNNSKKTKNLSFFKENVNPQKKFNKKKVFTNKKNNFKPKKKFIRVKSKEIDDLKKEDYLSKDSKRSRTLKHNIENRIYFCFLYQRNFEIAMEELQDYSIELKNLQEIKRVDGMTLQKLEDKLTKLKKRELKERLDVKKWEVLLEKIKTTNNAIAQVQNRIDSSTKGITKLNSQMTFKEIQINEFTLEYNMNRASVATFLDIHFKYNDCYCSINLNLFIEYFDSFVSQLASEKKYFSSCLALQSVLENKSLFTYKKTTRNIRHTIDSKTKKRILITKEKFTESENK